MALLGSASILLFIISLVVIINPNWFFRGSFKPSRRHVSIVTALSFVLFVFAVVNDEPTSHPQASAETSTSSKETSTTEKPKIAITDEAIKNTIEYAKKFNNNVRDAAVLVEGDKVTLAATVGFATSEEAAKEVGDGIIRLLASEVDGKGPTKDYYGELYDHYSLMVVVGTPDTKPIVMGAKAKGSRFLVW
ncbi:hypothetical protein [Brevibacillus daliensis]|uniref:hypothetical protein n=1 Tax=Brevibacillus daliensis TaxID=2892995 RepID=UPI001E3D38F6|nr:hypothetical protein [Brevibacillus daliensis]